jgi:type IV pilus biogenesis protein CpaD/CtpE
MNDAAPPPSFTAFPSDTAVAFLARLRPRGPWVLTAISPDPGRGGQTAVTTLTASNAQEVRDFVSQYDGKRNLYYSVNSTRRATNKKAANAVLAIDSRRDAIARLSNASCSA